MVSGNTHGFSIRTRSKRRAGDGFNQKRGEAKRPSPRGSEARVHFTSQPKLPTDAAALPDSSRNIGSQTAEPKFSLRYNSYSVRNLSFQIKMSRISQIPRYDTFSPLRPAYVD